MRIISTISSTKKHKNCFFFIKINIFANRNDIRNDKNDNRNKNKNKNRNAKINKINITTILIKWIVTQCEITKRFKRYNKKLYNCFDINNINFEIDVNVQIKNKKCKQFVKKDESNFFSLFSNFRLIVSTKFSKMRSLQYQNQKFQ